MKKKRYINEILKHIHTDKKTQHRIEEDLNERLDAAIDQDPYYDALIEMGRPEEVAKEFMDNLECEPHQEMFVKSRLANQPYEYKSKRTVLGYPLVHVNMGGRQAMPCIAKGVIAIGDVSIGVVSLGGISLGILSFGGVSLGLAAIGGVALGGAAFGGIAVGMVAFGGIAIGVLKALGGLSVLL
jgi:hypothetical protein